MQSGDDRDGEEKCEDTLGGKGESEPVGGFPGSDEELMFIVSFQGLS